MHVGEHGPEVVEWGPDIQTQFTVSPALIVMVLGKNAIPGPMLT